MSKYHDGLAPYYNSPVTGSKKEDTIESLEEELAEWTKDTKRGTDVFRSLAQSMVDGIERKLKRMRD